MEFLIIENLFYYTEDTKSFHLKGSVRNRMFTVGESQSDHLLLYED